MPQVPPSTARFRVLIKLLLPHMHYQLLNCTSYTNLTPNIFASLHTLLQRHASKMNGMTIYRECIYPLFISNLHEGYALSKCFSLVAM